MKEQEKIPEKKTTNKTEENNFNRWKIQTSSNKNVNWIRENNTWTQNLNKELESILINLMEILEQQQRT